MTLEKSSKKEITRRDFLKLGGLGVAGVAVVPIITGQESWAAGPLAGKKLAMVIDLQQCTGCGGCIVSCKSENNVQGDVFWSSRITKTVGKFPNVRFEYLPTLCNHCEKAPCVKGCPTRAMYKGEGDITMHDPDKCIGCRYCMMNCPYGVIHFNEAETHSFWRDETPLIDGVTESAAGINQQVGGTVVPYYNPERELSQKGTGLRKRGIVEKCTLCDHRVTKGQLPYCIESCPAKARIFGDLNDPSSEVNQLLGKYRAWRLKEKNGTEPKVFYVRSFNAGGYPKTEGSI